MLPLTIIIPAKYEEESIAETLHEIRKRVRTPHRIIVVNDSDDSDNTAVIVKRIARKNPHISLIVKRRKQGHGTFASALQLGVSRVKGGVFVPVMADMCDLPETIDDMYRLIQRGWDIVCGSRYMAGGKKIGGPNIQNTCSWCVCKTLHYISGIPTHDVSNSFKMYRVGILKDVAIDHNKGVEVSMDITLQAYFKGATIVEIPTVWTGRTKGASKFHIVERTPRYLAIYMWVLRKTMRRVLTTLAHSWNV